MKLPRIVIAGLRGGSGKTLLSVGLAAAWRKQGRRVAPFKKGPDYIDAAWLAAAAGRPCRNLDLFLMPSATVMWSFTSAAGDADIAIIEGNRGLYDGMDARGTYSTAELAKLLQAPVILAVDCTKATRTVAAAVLGCQQLDEDVSIRGVMLNGTAGSRHEAVLREAIHQYCGLPVLGSLRRIPDSLFPERHMGLLPPEEHAQTGTAVESAAELAEQHLNLKAVWSLAEQAPPLDRPDLFSRDGRAETPLVRIGVFRDQAFQFYYPENLEALGREGAELIDISPMQDRELPQVDALYVGGGFPETLAGPLADNRRFLASVRSAVESGLPVYAECGGAVYLGDTLVFEEKTYPFAGVLPVSFGFESKPRGHGYAVLETVESNPFFYIGDSLRGHEFHYTHLTSDPTALTFAFRVQRGHGFDGRRDGLCHRNVLACYTHAHALGVTGWAPGIVRAAARFKAEVADSFTAAR